MENIISATLSTAGRSMYQIVDDMYRAYGKNAGLTEALDVGLSRWKDTLQKGAGLAKPLLFGNYPSVESASDTNYQLLRDREPGIEQAIKVLNKDYKQGGDVTGTQNKSREPMPQEPGIADDPSLEGTELAYISDVANQLERKWLAPSRVILSSAGKQIEGVNSFYLMPMPNRNQMINKINEERRYQRMIMLGNVRKHEELISDRLGRPFTFKDFNPEDYTNPLRPAQ
jgi:hypothetical protein